MKPKDILILKIIKELEPYGYPVNIYRELKNIGKNYSLGTIYNVLDKLEYETYVSYVVLPGDFRRKFKVQKRYTVTNNGRIYLERLASANN